MKNKFLILILCISFNPILAQVLITETTNDESVTPNPSAQLEIRHKTKGVYIPQVKLSGAKDQSNVKVPSEGTLVFNTNKDIPEADYEGIAIWDGSQWLFSKTEKDMQKIIDVVTNKVYNGKPNIHVTYFPDEDIFFSKNEDFKDKNWVILREVTSDTFFGNSPNESKQKIIVDAEGIAAIDNSKQASGFSYAIGIFIDNKLVSVRKFNRESVSGQCVFDKFNIRGMVDSSSGLLNRPSNEPYNIKLAAISLKRIHGDLYYNEITFGGTAYGCRNLNKETAKTYLNILTIERKMK